MRTYPTKTATRLLLLLLCVFLAAFLPACAEDEVEVDEEKSDLMPPNQVRDLTAVATDGAVFFTWENPDTKEEGRDIPERDEEYKGVLVLRGVGEPPADLPLRKEKYEAGETIGGSEVAYVGGDEAFTDERLENGATVHYAFFTFDKEPNYGEPLRVNATPGSSVHLLVDPSLRIL